MILVVVAHALMYPILISDNPKFFENVSKFIIFIDVRNKNIRDNVYIIKCVSAIRHLSSPHIDEWDVGNADVSDTVSISAGVQLAEGRGEA